MVKTYLKKIVTYAIINLITLIIYFAIAVISLIISAIIFHKLKKPSSSVNDIINILILVMFYSIYFIIYYFIGKKKVDYINYVANEKSKNVTKYLFSNVKTDIISYCIFLLPLPFIMLMPRNILSVLLYMPQGSIYFIIHNVILMYVLNILVFAIFTIIFVSLIYKKWSKEILISKNDVGV